MPEMTYKDFSVFQRSIILHAHPATFVFHLLGFLWGGYFLWFHRLEWALFFFIFLPLMGHVLGWLDKTYRIVAGSKLNLFQKLLLYHFDLRNFLFHLAAFGFFIYGMWTHSALALLSAVSFILLGHITPWLKHGRHEAQYFLAMGGG